MEKLYYKPKKYLIRPIEKPDKIDISKHLVLFVNEDNSFIEIAIPDFDEKYIDSRSSNIYKINPNTEMSYFSLVEKNEYYTEEPVFSIIISEGKEGDFFNYDAPKVLSSKCVNGYNINLETIIAKSAAKLKKIK